jgi:hypothetical protein
VTPQLARLDTPVPSYLSLLTLDSILSDPRCVTHLRPE